MFVCALTVRSLSMQSFLHHILLQFGAPQQRSRSLSQVGPSYYRGQPPFLFIPCIGLLASPSRYAADVALKSTKTTELGQHCATSLIDSDLLKVGPKTTDLSQYLGCGVRLLSVLVPRF